MVAYCYRLVGGEPRFHQAALIMAPGLFAVFIAQVDFDSRDVITEATQGMEYLGLNPMDQCFRAINVVIGIDLYMHVFPNEWY